MSRIAATYRLARLLFEKGMSATEAVEEAKRKVSHHPTAEQFRAALDLRLRVKAVINGTENKKEI